MARIGTCPICGKPAPPRPENKAAPFCSERCKLLDLGKWLGGEYRIPGPSLGEEGGNGETLPPRGDGEEDDR